MGGIASTGSGFVWEKNPPEHVSFVYIPRKAPKEGLENRKLIIFGSPNSLSGASLRYGVALCQQREASNAE